MSGVRPGSRRWLAEAQGYICPWCELPFPEDLAGTAKDHIIPRCRGGPNKPWNYQLLHFKCNSHGGKGIKLTAEAEALAAIHGVRLHLPIPASAIAYRPLARRESLREDFLSELCRAGSDGTAVLEKYLDGLRQSA